MVRSGTVQKRQLLLGGLFLLFLVSLLVVVEEAEGKTITVDDDGGADYEKIQDAIDAAEDGDTVRVYEGLHREKLIVNKSINLQGNGSEATTINGSESTPFNGSVNDYVVWIGVDWVNMSGFSVTGSGNERGDSGIWVCKSYNINIYGNNCSNNRCGIYVTSSSDCEIENNICSASNDMIGIDLRTSSFCTIENNTCSANGWSGIGLSDSSSYCTIKNNTLNENGIFIFGYSLETWNSHTIEETNTINGKPVYYYKNISGFTVPSGAGLSGMLYL